MQLRHPQRRADDRLDCASGCIPGVHVWSDRGRPIPSGGYTPSALIGALFLVVGILSSISGSAAVTGLACGLAIVTKHDAWLPGVGVLALLAVQRRRDWKVALACAAL